MAMTRDEAVARADEWLNGASPAEQRLQVGLREFDLGYVAWGIEPPPTDPSQPPASSGAARAVIDKASGELTTFPSLPVDVIIEQYRQQHAAEPRFPDDVRQVLQDAGWFPGRSVTADIDRWAAGFTPRESPKGRRHELFPAARAVLDEFGGLKVGQRGHGQDLGRFPFAIYPATDWFPDPDLYAEFAEEIGKRAFPIGIHDDGPSELAIDEDGRVFLLHWSDDLLEGETIDEALVTLIRGAQPRASVGEGTW
jgi:hypothetical protein